MSVKNKSKRKRNTMSPKDILEIPKRANNKSSPVRNQETPKVGNKLSNGRKIFVTNAEVHEMAINKQVEFDNIEVIETLTPNIDQDNLDKSNHDLFPTLSTLVLENTLPIESNKTNQVGETVTNNKFNHLIDEVQSECECSDSEDSEKHANENDTLNNNICQTCLENVSDDNEAVCCDRCDIWFHSICQNISSKEYEMIKYLKDKVIWCCYNCLENSKSILDENSSLRKEVTLLKTKVNIRYIEKQKDVCTENLSNLTLPDENNVEIHNKSKSDDGIHCKIDKLRNELYQEICSIKDKIDKNNDKENTANNLDKVLAKREENKERENNLIFFNIVESNKEAPKERENEDAEVICNILDYGVYANDYCFTKTIRIGKPGQNKPRPLLVKFSNPQEKWNILKQARNLKNANEEYRKVSIAPDYDEEERKQHKILFQELKQKRLNGEHHWYISNGKLCQRENFGN